jgi:hypothetical protein
VQDVGEVVVIESAVCITFQAVKRWIGDEYPELIQAKMTEREELTQRRSIPAHLYLESCACARRA